MCAQSFSTIEAYLEVLALLIDNGVFNENLMQAQSSLKTVSDATFSKTEGVSLTEVMEAATPTDDACMKRLRTRLAKVLMHRDWYLGCMSDGIRKKAGGNRGESRGS